MITKGQKINDRYEIIRSIGEGGMANVYLGYDTILDRNVAIKVLRGDLSNDEKFVRRFQREALSASSLSHSNIVEVYDVGEEEGNYYIVMEYIDGKTHNYYPDYIVEMENGDKLVIEIKPKNQTIRPVNENSKSYEMYVKNMCKWKAAKRYCEMNGYKFQILTEETISRLK